MCLVVTGVGTLIHIYSAGYMCHDESQPRYFAYLNLFLFFMLILVLGKNMIVLFAGWEGVGLASYLLIGFWYKDAEKSAAGMKAFIVNRVGDSRFYPGSLPYLLLQPHPRLPGHQQLLRHSQPSAFHHEPDPASCF